MTARPTIRAATSADLPGIAAVLAENGEPLEQPDVPGYPYLEHLLARGRVPVAELGDRLVGFASAVAVGTGIMLTDLFVDPPNHGRGVGTALLEAALLDDVPRMTFSSADPRALPVYVRAGMLPWWPNLYVRADRAALARLPEPGGLTVEPATVGMAADAALALSGIDRREDFAFYAVQRDAAGHVVRDAGAVSAVGWAHRDDDGDGRTLAHATIAGDTDPVRTVVALLRAAAGRDPISACVPGPHPALPVLLEAGWRITDRDTFCTSDPGWLDPVRILPNPGLL
jgi:GNAT superfamily N-acetyltransferase